MAHAAARHPDRVVRGFRTLVLACAFVGTLPGTWPRAAAAQADLMEVLSAVVAVQDLPLGRYINLLLFNRLSRFEGKKFTKK